MSPLIEVRVPDGDEYEDAEVIELHVNEGDTVQAMDSLITIESGKASMDIPAPFAGVVRALKLNLGDPATAGKLIAVLEVEAS